MQNNRRYVPAVPPEQLIQDVAKSEWPETTRSELNELRDRYVELLAGVPIQEEWYRGNILTLLWNLVLHENSDDELVESLVGVNPVLDCQIAEYGPASEPIVEALLEVSDVGWDDRDTEVRRCLAGRKDLPGRAYLELLTAADEETRTETVLALLDPKMPPWWHLAALLVISRHTDIENGAAEEPYKDYELENMLAVFGEGVYDEMLLLALNLAYMQMGLDIGSSYTRNWYDLYVDYDQLVEDFQSLT